MTQRMRLTTAVSLSTERECNNIGSDTYTATRAATTRVDSKVVRAANLTTARRVALGVVVASHISPLTESSFTEEYGTGLAELSYDVSITGNHTAEKGPATGGGFQVILGADVVLDSEGDAVEGTSDLAVASFRITLSSNGEKIRVDLEDGPGEGEYMVEGGDDFLYEKVDLLDVFLSLICTDKIASHQLNRSQPASLHSLLHLINSSFLQLETIAISHGEQVLGASIFLKRDQIRRIREQRLSGQSPTGEEASG